MYKSPLHIGLRRSKLLRLLQRVAFLVFYLKYILVYFTSLKIKIPGQALNIVKHK